MTDQKQTILRRLESVSQPAVPAMAMDWLSRMDTHPLSESAVTVSNLRQVWSVRSGISESKGHAIEGVRELLCALKELHPNLKVDQVSFAGSDLMGNFFFKREDQTYLGSVLFAVNRAAEELQRAS